MSEAQGFRPTGAGDKEFLKLSQIFSAFGEYDLTF